MEEATQALTNLGLMPIQAKLLIVLQKFNYASVEDLSKASEIHPQQVYPALADLQNLGLVEKKMGRPTQYKTSPLDQILHTLIDRKSKWIAELNKKTPSIVKKVNDELKPIDSSTLEKIDFTLITGFEMLYTATHDWVRNAHKIDWIVLFDRLTYQTIDRFETAKYDFQKDVKIRLLTPAKPENVKLDRISNIEMRFTKYQIPNSLAIYDSQRVMTSMISNSENIFEIELIALVSNHPGYVSMMQNYFDLLWNNAYTKEELALNQLQ